MGHQGVPSLHRGTGHFRQLADRTHVTLRIYNRLVDHAEQHRIIQNANRRNRLRFGGDDIQEMVDAEHNLKRREAAVDHPVDQR